MLSYSDNNNNDQTFVILTENSEQYNIRSMNVLDIDAVAQIDRKTWGKTSWLPNDFFRCLEDPMWCCWVMEGIEHDSPIVGYGLQYFSNDTSHIANLCIRPNHCGRGLGGFLLRYMIDHARHNGASNVTLEVHTTNARAYTLYANHGFTIIEFIEEYYLDKADAYRMQLIFDSSY